MRKLDRSLTSAHSEDGRFKAGNERNCVARSGLAVLEEVQLTPVRGMTSLLFVVIADCVEQIKAANLYRWAVSVYHDGL